jgi:hypothetical protein
MWDELLGVAVFVVLFIGGLFLYDLVEKRRRRKTNERKQ